MNNQAIGNRIKSIRKNLGLTTEKFANYFDPPASKGTISKWENGHYLPNNERLKIIASLGNISVDELLYGTVDEKAKSVLFKEIEEHNKLFDQIIEYLSMSSELGEVLNGLLVDHDGSFMEPNKAMSELNYIKIEMAKDFIENHLQNIIKKIKSSSPSNVSLVELDQEIINGAISYVWELTLSQSYSIEGYYRQLINSLENITPSAMGFNDLDFIIKTHKNQGMNDKEAKSKALEKYYQSAMADVQMNTMQELREIWREYQEKIQNL